MPYIIRSEDQGSVTTKPYEKLQTIVIWNCNLYAFTHSYSAQGGRVFTTMFLSSVATLPPVVSVRISRAVAVPTQDQQRFEGDFMG